MLQTIGGYDLKGGVRRILKTTIEPVLLSQFNWTVTKTHVSSTQKLPFKDLAFCPVLTSEYTLLTLHNIKVYLLCFKKRFIGIIKSTDWGQ